MFFMYKITSPLFSSLDPRLQCSFFYNKKLIVRIQLKDENNLLYLTQNDKILRTYIIETCNYINIIIEK